MVFSQKIKNRTTIWSSNSTSAYLSKGNKNTNWKRCLHPHVHCSIIYNSQNIETTEVSSDGWMNKVNVVSIYNGMLLSHVKGGNPAIFNNMDGPWGHYARWNKWDRERQILCDLTCMWNLKKKKITVTSLQERSIIKMWYINLPRKNKEGIFSTRKETEEIQ